MHQEQGKALSMLPLLQQGSGAEGMRDDALQPDGTEGVSESDSSHTVSDSAAYALAAVGETQQLSEGNQHRGRGRLEASERPEWKRVQQVCFSQCRAPQVGRSLRVPVLLRCTCWNIAALICQQLYLKLQKGNINKILYLHSQVGKAILNAHKKEAKAERRAPLPAPARGRRVAYPFQKPAMPGHRLEYCS